jgi:putative hydrolase of the HAD superfamily
MIRVVAFDLDDTLWAVDPVITRAEQCLREWLGQELPAVDYSRDTLGKLRHEVLALHPELAHRVTDFRLRLLETAMIRSGIPEEDAGRLAQQAMEVFLVARNEIEFFEGALDAIKHIATRYQLGALTNGNADIHRLGLADHFSFAFSAEQVGAPKPAPDLFLRALQHTGVDPHEMVYVGDDPEKDVDAANRVGLRTIWVRNITRPGPGETTPDHTIEHIRELPGALDLL